jgi:1-pyrroline-5-carboxylate dehydrogenase
MCVCVCVTAAASLTEAEAAAVVSAMHQPGLRSRGLHNPWFRPERYVQLGELSARAAAEMRAHCDWFARLLQVCCPKSTAQARGEVTVTTRFLENFAGDQVRFLARGFSVAGDHAGQRSSGWRWPYGPVAVVAPFNFPLEIPMLQLMGALYMGNRVLLKPDSRVAIVMEQVMRMLLAAAAGTPGGAAHDASTPLSVVHNDVDMVCCDGASTMALLKQVDPVLTQFTGSSRVAELLSREFSGRVRIEDAGFDWKILGPDVSDVDYVAWTSDQDAYASSGQKCSAQSILFAHKNWTRTTGANAPDIFGRIKRLAARRNLADLTVGPLLSVNNSTIRKHQERLLQIPGARIEFGGSPLTDHSIPAVYGSWQPTAVFVPLKEMVSSPERLELVTTEIFGPFQVITEFGDEDLDTVLQCIERMSHHLTAGIVSNDVHFQERVLGSTVNGTTYCGIRARTTGAPQNHWFGPAGDPRAAGIGSPEAIKMVWSAHREIIFDVGPIASKWTTPKAS